MPELPEVEVTRLSFASRVQGATVLSASLGKPLRWPLGIDVQALIGQQVLGVRRRGKYLLLDLSGGLLLVHLGMSGSVVFGNGLAEAGKHDHFDLCTTQGTLRLNDPRRFGAVVFAASEADPVAHKLLAHLGVEPLGGDFDAGDFYQALHLRKTAIKQVLLAGELVVGVGNIYASEALFMAGIRPTTRCNRISRARTLRLQQAIRTVLARAVEQGGSTLRDFSNAQGEAGHFQLEAMVYGRAGQPCRICAAPVLGIKQGQRSTFYCSQCQKS
jgi:formamidopyrimidine-DNA glycosylase